MSEAGLLLAVDGGGTKTHALVTDLQGKVLARGLGPGSNIHNVGFEQSCKAVTTAIDGALLQVIGLRSAREGQSWRGAPIAAACFGLAGVDAPEDEAEIARWVRAADDRGPVPGRQRRASWCWPAARPTGWGVALISGTGSVCLGRGGDGRTVRVGGWGPLLSDEGSGYEIASHALRAVARSVDGREQAPALVKAVLRHWSLRDPISLIRFVHAPTTTATEIAGLAPVVVEQAQHGDAVARDILERAARELAGPGADRDRAPGADPPALGPGGRHAAGRPAGGGGDGDRGHHRLRHLRLGPAAGRGGARAPAAGDARRR